MGIGPGIVTRSAKRPKYKIGAAPAHSYRETSRIRRCYQIFVRTTASGNVYFYFNPLFNRKERKAINSSGITQREYNLFVLCLCNHIERTNISRQFPRKYYAMVDSFIERFPRWAPEKNVIKPKHRAPFLTYL